MFRRGALALGVLVVAFSACGRGADVPQFPSLAAHPDPSLTGTVAYFEGETRCVWLVAAAGTPSKKAVCLPPIDTQAAIKARAKETDPQLVWRPDGRLEITVFRASVEKGKQPTTSADWQKVVDVRTGEVVDTPSSDVPATPNYATRPVVDANDRRVSFTSDPQFGHVAVKLTQNGKTRTLLSASGPSKYTYGINAAFWSPDGKWVAVDDGRILVVTPDPTPRTRVLTDRAHEGGGMSVGDARFATFAVTDTDVLGNGSPSGCTTTPTTAPPTSTTTTSTTATTAAVPNVAAIETSLAGLGYLPGPVDGVFDYDTKHAVVAFQKLHGLPRDGVAGARFEAALANAGRPVPRSVSDDHLEIDLTHQVLLDVHGGATAAVLDISSGRRAGTTPLGHFHITREIDGYHRSPLGVLYRPKYFHKGVAIHGYPSVPPYPASHGCVRTTNHAMDWLWSSDTAPVGTPVWVYR